MKGKLDPAWKGTIYAQLLIILAFICSIFSIPIMLVPAPFPSILLALLLIIIFIITIPVVLWTPAFYNSFSYELLQDFVKINKGVITKKETKIPYGRVQDLNILKGPIQRLFGIATVEIQTAGTAVATSPSGKAVEGEIPGVRNPEKIIDAVMRKVQGMKSEASGLEGRKDVQVLILDELKKISKKLK